MIQPSDWRKIRLRCAQLINDRPALMSANRKLKITHLLYDVRPPEQQAKLHVHSEYELIVLLDDDMSESEASDPQIHRGRAALYSPQQKHLGHTTDTTCQLFVVHFSLEPALAIPMRDEWPVYPELADEAEKLSLLLLGAASDDLSYACSHLIMLILRALRLFAPEKQTVTPVADKRDLPEEIQQMVKDNPSRRITLEDLASQFGMSVRHLSRSFHAETRDTIVSHIIRCRLDIARSLLRESDAKISDICARVGIPDQTYFCRCFRKYFGSTPNEYRKMARQNAAPANQNEK